MALKPEDVQASEAEYQEAFNESEVETTEMSEDEAFGLMPEPASQEGDVEVTVDTDDTMQTEAEAAIESAELASTEGESPDEGGGPAGEGGEQMADAATTEDPMDDEPTDPKEIQRKKSWEGRLRKREEELAAKAAELEARNASPDAPADEAAETPSREEAVEAVQDAVDAVEDGDMTPEQAIKTISEDFGPEFTKMLQTLIKAEAGKVKAETDQGVDELVQAIKDDKAREHFEAIADAHPDFNEVGGSDEMVAYLEDLPDEDRAKAQKVVEGGSTRQVIKLLNGFKEWKAKGATPKGDVVEGDEPAAAATPAVDDPAMDAAEGVRSTGLRLPPQPARSDDYENSWDQF
jgi:hypothetical protein